MKMKNYILQFVENNKVVSYFHFQGDYTALIACH